MALSWEEELPNKKEEKQSTKPAKKKNLQQLKGRWTEDLYAPGPAVR